MNDTLTRTTSSSDVAEPGEQPLRVVVVDDQRIIRRFVKAALNEIAGIEVVGEAENGKAGLEQVRRLRPDLLTLDVEMPEMNGLEVLKELKSFADAPKALMLSSLTKLGADTTIQALGLGAYDFLVKPDHETPETVTEYLVNELTPRLDSFSWMVRGKGLPQPAKKKLPTDTLKQVETTQRRRIDAIAIGVSTGGPEALRQVIPKLPKSLPVPVLVVQHMPALFTKSLADNLASESLVPVHEGENGMPIKPGNVYIAPGGHQMGVIRAGGKHQIIVTDDPPIESCRPSVNYLLNSMSKSYENNFLPVIMTGMGYDGTEECRKLHSCGVKIVAQNQQSCTVYGMPRQLIEDNLAMPVHLDDIARTIVDRLARNV